MSALGFFDSCIDFNAPEMVAAYDELPLWSAAFELLLLEEVPLARVRKVLDVGCGTGFPLIELAERPPLLHPPRLPGRMEVRRRGKRAHDL